MHSQVTSELLMVRPANFSSNIETLKSNNFQERLQKTDSKNNIAGACPRMWDQPSVKKNFLVEKIYR